MWVYLILAGFIVGEGVAVILLARSNGRLKKERDNAIATAKLKDQTASIAANARPGDGGAGLRDGSF